MQKNVLQVSGVIVEGHHVASGPSQAYPYGTLERQKPFFKAKGLDLNGFFSGTLNVSIAPLKYEMVNPAYTFRNISWTDLHPPEDFSFSPCRVLYLGKRYGGYIYYPHPETKIRHFQDSSVMEVITIKIPFITYGSHVEMVLDKSAIHFFAV
jgi:hypothetical protein